MALQHNLCGMKSRCCSAFWMSKSCLQSEERDTENGLSYISKQTPTELKLGIYCTLEIIVSPGAPNFHLHYIFSFKGLKNCGKPFRSLLPQTPASLSIACSWNLIVKNFKANWWILSDFHFDTCAPLFNLQHSKMTPTWSNVWPRSSRLQCYDTLFSCSVNKTSGKTR